MNAPVLVPYAETRFRWAEASRELHVSAPWLDIEVEVEDPHARQLAAALGQEGDGCDVECADMQAFLRFFGSYPLLQTRPRPAVDADCAWTATSGAREMLGFDGPIGFYAAIGPFPRDQLVRAMPHVPQVWEWDWTELADASRIPGTCLHDPAAAYTALRRRRLLFQVEQSVHANHLLVWLRHLQQSDEPRFFEAMALVLSQQYYVTQHCDDCLMTARGGLPVLSKAVAAYAQEEIDHHILIRRSIDELCSVPPEAYRYMPEVVLEIDVIRWAAARCPLGFSALVSIMEGTVYPASDPVGDLLSASSRPQARDGVEAHFQINKRGNHTAIPERFVDVLPPVDADTIRIATHLTEATIRLDAGLARSLMGSLGS